VIGRVRHAWPEKKGFILDRKDCGGEYIFIHFWQPVELTVDGKVYNTEPNAVIIIDKASSNRILCENHDLIHDYIHVKNDNLPNILLDFSLQTNVVYYPQNCGFITDIVRKIEAETFENDKFFNEVSLNYLKILFALVSRSLDKRPEGFVIDYKTESEFKNLRMMVFSNLERDWSISHMAEIVSLSESRFYVLYKAIFKTTPNQDLIMARMDQAKRLLSQNRNIAILDVAQKCGYSNEFHFIRIFKKNVGLTPKKYALLQFSQRKTMI
jgi:AraC family transcriptional regulator of arabinose operon